MRKIFLRALRSRNGVEYVVFLHTFLFLLRNLSGEYLSSSAISNVDIQYVNLTTVCFQQDSCAVGQFCAFNGFLDGWLRYGSCQPCAECICDGDAIDNVCPLNNCPLGEFAGISSLQGSFYNGQAVSGGDVCLTVWVFGGQTFRQLSFYVQSALYYELVNAGSLYSPEVNFTDASTLCSELHAGIKGGVFNIDSQNKMVLMYTNGYNFYQNVSIYLTAQLIIECPNVVLKLDRSTIPKFISKAAGWNPTAEAMAAYDYVSDPVLSCNGARGFCLRSSNFESLLPASYLLRRFAAKQGQGAPLTVFSGYLRNQAWAPNATSEFRFMLNGSLCTLVVEQSNLQLGIVYLRTQVYGCLAQESFEISTVTTTAPVLAATSFVTTMPITTAITPIPGTKTTTYLEARTTTPRPTVTRPVTLRGPCQGSGNLNSFAGFTKDTAYRLNCSSGQINLLQYPLAQSRFWRIDVEALVALWFSAPVGFQAISDYISITSASSQPTFITGYAADPSPIVRIKVCAQLSSCTQGGRVYEMIEYNQTFQGPLLINFVSNSNLDSGGAILEYSEISDSRRAIDRSNQFSTDNALSGKRNGKPNFEELAAGSATGILGNPTMIRSSGAAPPPQCKCSIYPNQTCPSLFFRSPVCNAALGIAPWLTYHTPNVISITSTISESVDAIVYLEMFSNLESSNGLYVTASFDIFTPNLAHSLDVIALFKGDDGVPDTCDTYRTLNSCAKSSSLLSPPTLSKQLCWAYTSALGNPWADDHTPVLNVQLNAGTAKFCSDVTVSAGDGTYYVVLYSHILKKLIASVDYIQSRDCHGSLFPCSPALKPNPNRIFDNTGPLGVCQPMWFRNSQAICEQCPLRSYSADLNSPSCFTCPSGQYSSPPYTSCTQCPKKPDPSLLLYCNITATAHNATLNISTGNTTTTTRAALVGTTARVKSCGDGIITASAEAAGGVPEECDDGPPSQWAKLPVSQSFSIFEIWTPSKAAFYLQTGYSMCDHVSCQLQAYYCGDGILTTYRPVYTLSECITVNGLLVCDSTTELKEGNKTAIYNEECDDGNNRNGDGCSSECTVESLFLCETIQGSYYCRKTCPDGKLQDDGEQCDDGNSNDGDGCSNDCQIECGFGCQNPSKLAPSICGTVCGDGVIAGTEQCDVALVESSLLNPSAEGCNSYCQVERGWECNIPPSVCDTKILTLTTCAPKCGDGFIVPPEQCDDGGWNLQDKACLPTCRINFGEVCYGPMCLSPLPSQTPDELELMSILQNTGRGMAEAVFLLRDIFNNSEGMLARALGFWPQKYSSLASMFGAVVVVNETPLEANEATSVLTPAFCSKVPSTIWRATSGTIAEYWKILSNNVSCSYMLSPAPVGRSSDYYVVKLEVHELSIFSDSYIVLKQSLATANKSSGAQCEISANHQGNIYLLAPMGIEMFAFSESSNIDHMLLAMNIHFSILKDTETTLDKVFCLSECGCDFVCGRLCFETNQRALDRGNSLQSNQVVNSSSKTLESTQHDLRVARPALNENFAQVFAINYASTEFDTPQNQVQFPTEFAQLPPESLLINIKGATSFVDSSFEGSWQGRCSSDLSGGFGTVCNVSVFISNDTIIKDVSNCPLRSISVGRLVQMDQQLSMFEDLMSIPCYFAFAQIVWTTSDGTMDSPNKITESIFSIGHSIHVDSDLQILFAGGTKTVIDSPVFRAGGIFPDESNCRLLSLKRSNGKNKLNALAQAIPRANDELHFIDCNMSLAKSVAKLQQHSKECLTLLHVLLLRDFWTPINMQLKILDSEFVWQPLSEYVCSSTCLELVIYELQKSVAVCENAWKGPWWNWHVGLRLFKLLISAASALFWATVLCGSNREGQSCASLISSPDLACPGLLHQSLYGPLFTMPNQACSQSCMTSLHNYVADLDCCASTVDKAGRVWLQTLMNPSLAYMSVDFGQRSNPFNTTFPEVAVDPVLIYFNTSSSFAVSQSGVLTNISDGFVPIISLQSLMADSCNSSCNWPIDNQVCCNSLNCVNGNKPYAGACYCECPPGFQGQQCEIQGFFVKSSLLFPGMVFLDAFTYCQERNIVKLVSESFEIGSDQVQFQISGNGRRLSPTGVTATLLMQTVSCDDSNRLAQKLASFSQVGSRFEAAGVPTPEFASIRVFCDGSKTACGATSVNGKVDLQALYSSCSSGDGNHSTNTTKEEIGNVSRGMSSSWQVAFSAFAGALVLCLSAAVVFFYKGRIWAGLLHCKAHFRKRKRKLPKVNFINPTADIVFLNKSDQTPTKGMIVISQVQKQDFEVEYLNTYIKGNPVNDDDCQIVLPNSFFGPDFALETDLVPVSDCNQIELQEMEDEDIVETEHKQSLTNVPKWGTF